MVFHNTKKFALKNRIVGGCLLLVAFNLLFAGCSSLSSVKKTTKRIAYDLNPLRANLKKKIEIVRITNQTFYTAQNFEDLFRQSLSENIRAECPRILLVEPGDSVYAGSKAAFSSQEAGPGAKLALAQTGRRRGINAFLTGAIADIRGKDKTRGILWYKDTYYFIHVTILIEVYDTETGAKFLDESYFHEIEVDEYEYRAVMDQKKVRLDDIAEAIEHIAGVIGEEVCDTLRNQPWKGYVASIAEDRIIISSGRSSGLQPGDTLKVYDSGKVIEGSGGQQFFLPGPNTGEVKITAVYDDTAEAIPLSGKDIMVGNSVKP